MLKRKGSKKEKERSELKEKMMDKIGLDNVLNRIERIGKERRNGLDKERKKEKIERNNIEIEKVKMVEEEIVKIKKRKRIIGYYEVYDIREREKREIEKEKKKKKENKRSEERKEGKLKREVRRD